MIFVKKLEYQGIQLICLMGLMNDVFASSKGQTTPWHQMTEVLR